jgi:hypothetical protein
MNRIFAVAASLLVNLGLVYAFERSANEAVPVPNGQVLISYAAEQPIAALAKAGAVDTDDHRALAL